MSITALSQQVFSSVYLALGSSFGGSATTANIGTSGASPAGTPAPTPGTSTTPSTPNAPASPAAAATAGNSQGNGLQLFFSAVLEAFARITGGSDSSTSPSTASDASSSDAGSAASSSNAGASGAPAASNGGSGSGSSLQIRAKEKVQLELQVQNNGDFSLNVEVDTKVKVRGGSAADSAQTASDLLKALQDFTANLFSALQSVVSGLLSSNGTGTTPALTGTSSPPTLPAATGVPPTTGVTAPDATTTGATSAAASTTASDTAATDTPAAGTIATTPASTTTAAPQIPSLYVSFEFKLRALVDDVTRADRNDPTLPQDRHARVHHLREHFNRVTNALPSSAPTTSDTATAATSTAPAATNSIASAAPSTGSVPSLADFLRQLTITPARAVSLAYSVRAGALLNVQA